MSAVRHEARIELLRPTLVLLAGGALAQALPLLLGPWLTRLYLPREFGIYYLFATVAANVAVVACARYEFALPLARDDEEATALRLLCLRILLAVTLTSALAGLLWARMIDAAWPLWLPPMVAALGLVSLSTLWAMRAQRFRALAASRIAQHGGGALLQAGAGIAHGGVAGLVAAPIVSALCAAALLGLPLRGARGAQRLGVVARRYRDFPLLNTPHAFAGALQDTLAVVLVAASLDMAAAGFWGLALRYLKAPATLVGGALSQALYPKLALAGGATRETRAAVVRSMGVLTLIASPLVLLLWAFGPWAFERAFGAPWREAGELARALALYVGVHFVASPLGVVTMAWGAQAWALKLALVGQVVFIIALGLGLHIGGLRGAGWAVSLAMCGYFGYYFRKLATWPLTR